MKCLIIAAGMGTRFYQEYESKPLIPVLGKPLIERVICSVMEAGISDFCIVTGFNGEKIRKFLDNKMQQYQINITHIINEEWEKGNGLSVLKAVDILDENFILVMSDHLFDSSIPNNLKRQECSKSEIILAVDRNLENPLIDIEDVTKVETSDNKIVNIGKDLQSYDCFDTGIFLWSPAIFQSLRESIAERDDTSLSGGVKKLAEKGNAKTFDIDNRFWIDVNDAEALQKAENLL